MKRVRKHLTFANVMSMIAVFAVLGGSAFAASKISGKKIKKASITGNKLKAKTLIGNKLRNKTLTGGKFKNDTLTGRQIKESTLGTVPRADVAATAGTVNAVPGAVAAGLVPRGKVLATDLIKLPAVGTSKETSPLKTVFTNGPFTFQVACWDAGGGTTAMRFLFTSTEPGSILDNEPLPLDQTNTPVASKAPDDAAAAMAAPSGATLFASIYTGIKALGADCVVAAQGVVG